MRLTVGTMTLAATMLVGAGVGFSERVHAEPVKLVTGNGYKPFADEGLPNGGLVTDLVRQAYKNAGHQVKIDFMPWKRGERMMAEGKRVATFPYVETKERKKKYLYSDPVFVAEERPVVHKSDAGSIDSYDDLRGKTYCLPVGWKTGDPKLSEMVQHEEVEVVKPQEITSCFRMLKADRADFTALERPTAILKKQQGEGAASEIHVEGLTLTRNGLHLIFGKNVDRSEEAREKFNRALDKLRESGKHKQIVQNHLGTDGSS